MKSKFFFLCLLGFIFLIRGAYAQETAYVVNTQSASVTAVDINARTRVADIAVGAVPVDIVVTPDTTRLAVLCALGDTTIRLTTPPDTLIGGNIHFIDPITNTVDTIIAVSGLNGSSIPSNIAFNESGTLIYVTYLSENRIQVYETDGDSVAEISLPGAGPTDLAFRRGVNSDSLVVLEGSRGRYSVIDAANNTATPTNILLEGLNGGTPSLPIALAITKDGNKAFVSNNADFDFSVVDLTTNTVSRLNAQFGTAFISGAVGLALTPNDSLLIIAAETGNQILVASAQNDSVLSTIFLPFGPNASPVGVAAGLNNDKAVISFNGRDSLAILDLNSLSYSTVPVGSKPRIAVVVDVDPCRAVGLTQVADTICDSDLPFTFGTQSLNAAGTFFENFLTPAGCDSVVELTLTVNPGVSVNLSQEICEGDTFFFGSQVLVAGGTYTQNLSTAEGCDSIINLNLTVNDTFNVVDSAFICQGQSLVFGSQTLDSSGVYTETFQSREGCDSTVSLTLNVGNKVVVNRGAAICEGDSLSFGGQFIKIAGIYTDSLISSTGCDSIVNLTLRVNPVFDVQVQDTICENELPFTFGRQTIDTAGIYVETFATVSGCDSTVELDLFVNPSFNERLADTLCEDELPIMLGSQMIDSAGVYTETFTSVQGCDSTVELSLVVNPSFQVSVEESICEDELPFVFGSQSLNMGGNFTETFTLATGCDSVVELELTVNPIFNLTVNDTVGQSDLPIDFGSQTLTMAGTYTETFGTAAGCDSVVTLVLEVLTGLELPYWAGGLNLYPNPAQDRIRLSLDLEGAAELRIMVINELGQEVMAPEIYWHKGGQQGLDLSTESLSSGIYLMRIEIEGRSVLRRFSILK